MSTSDNVHIKTLIFKTDSAKIQKKRQYTAKVHTIRTFCSEAVRNMNRNITMRENYLENKQA